ncbi:MAG: hypothetical protein WCH39_17620 [Schlesneria sp.]
MEPLVDVSDSGQLAQLDPQSLVDQSLCKLPGSLLFVMSKLRQTVGSDQRQRVTTKDTKNTKMEFDDLSNRVIACAIEVHRFLGPG